MVSIEIMLPYAGQKVDSYIVSIDSTHIFCGPRELHDPNWYMVSVEMMILYAGQKVDSYIVYIDSAQIFCGLRQLCAELLRQLCAELCVKCA